MFISTRRDILINKLWFVLYDFLAILISVYVAGLIRFGFSDIHSYVGSRFPQIFLSIAVFIILFYINGLYEQKRFSSSSKIIKSAVLAVFVGVILNAFVFFATFSLAIGRGVFLIKAVFILVLVCVPRLIYSFKLGKKFLSKRLVVIGSGESILDALDLIERYKSSLYTVIGVVSDDKNFNFKEYKILGDVGSLKNLVDEFNVDSILVTSLEPDKHRILENLRICRYYGIEIMDLVCLYEELENYVPLQYIDDEWLFSSTMGHRSFHVRKVKRLMDIVISSVGLLITLPLTILTSIAIKLDSKGPIFYTQERLGRGSKIFKIIKFRSMLSDAEKNTGAVWALKEDSRITRVGTWIRKMRIDEIPQLLNVLVGDMSLVGPRPERPEFIEELSREIPFYKERLYVQPGITGWAQINHPYSASLAETKIKLQYDIYYIKHISFVLDCYILFKTILVMVFLKGR